MENPQAFPVPALPWECGMTLRDYFASSAMNGICLNSRNTIELDDKTTAECIAKLAYEIADAMLKARDTNPFIVPNVTIIIL